MFWCLISASNTKYYAFCIIALYNTFISYKLQIQYYLEILQTVFNREFEYWLLTSILLTHTERYWYSTFGNNSLLTKWGNIKCDNEMRLEWIFQKFQISEIWLNIFFMQKNKFSIAPPVDSNWKYCINHLNGEIC